jgi:uridine kinase
MNIIDAYKNKFGNFIVLISGLSGTGKTKVAKTLATELNLKFINLSNYYDVDKLKEIELPNNIKVKNWFSTDIINWNKLNEDINAMKEGVIVTGIGFPEEKINEKQLIHIHIKIPKEDLLKKRADFKKEHKTEDIDKETEKIIMEKYTYPFYEKITKEGRINKFINIKEMSEEKILDDVFNILMKIVQDKLYKESKDIVWNEEKKCYEKIISK